MGLAEVTFESCAIEELFCTEFARESRGFVLLLAMFLDVNHLAERLAALVARQTTGQMLGEMLLHGRLVRRVVLVHATTETTGKSLK